MDEVEKQMVLKDLDVFVPDDDEENSGSRSLLISCSHHVYFCFSSDK